MRAPLAEQPAELSSKEKCAALADAFRKLPIRTVQGPYTIPAIAREFARMAGARPKVSARMAASIDRKLATMKRCADALYEQLDSLGPLSIEQRAAIITLARLPRAAKMPRSAKKKPRKTLALRIACSAAVHYFHLTGEKPAIRNVPDGGAYGPFLDLLKTVYGVLDIDASAYSIAKSPDFRQFVDNF